MVSYNIWHIQNMGNDILDNKSMLGDKMRDNKWSDFVVYNKGWLRWNNGELIIFGGEINKTERELKSLMKWELEKDDKIIWVKDLPIDIKKQYLNQIKEKNDN